MLRQVRTNVSHDKKGNGSAPNNNISVDFVSCFPSYTEDESQEVCAR